MKITKLLESLIATQKEINKSIKEFCDICKVEIDRHEVLNLIVTPKKILKYAINV